MESRFLDRLALKPAGPGQQTLHPLVVASYSNENVYTQARYTTDLVITYHPVVSMDTLGTVYYGFSRDGVAPSPSAVAALHPKSATAVWKKSSIRIGKELLNTQQWARMRDPSGYLIYWWSTPTPPGYFTLTCTIKATNPTSDTLPPTPEPLNWPITPIRGLPGPSLYKVGFATCYASVGGGADLLSDGAWAMSSGLAIERGAILSTNKACDPTRNYSIRAASLYPNHRSLIIFFAMIDIIYQSDGGQLSNQSNKYASRGARLNGVTVNWISKNHWNKIFPIPDGNKTNNYPLMGWAIMEFTTENIWRDWSPDPCPTGIMMMYYAIPPGMEVVTTENEGFPCVSYPLDDQMATNPVPIPITMVPQWGVFSNLAVDRV